MPATDIVGVEGESVAHRIFFMWMPVLRLVRQSRVVPVRKDSDPCTMKAEAPLAMSPIEATTRTSGASTSVGARSRPIDSMKMIPGAVTSRMPLASAPIVLIGVAIMAVTMIVLAVYLAINDAATLGLVALQYVAVFGAERSFSWWRQDTDGHMSEQHR